MLKLLKLPLKFPLKIRFLIIALITGLAICFSFLTEFFSNQLPCPLCSIQRWIYISLFPFALICVFSDRKELTRRFCQIILIAGFLTASYHSLVQFKIVKDRCQKPKIENLASYKELLTQRKKQKTSCSEIILKIGPFPLSTINAVLSLALLILTQRTKFSQSKEN